MNAIMTHRFPHKMRVMSLLAEELVASPEGLCCMECVSYDSQVV